MQRQDGTFHFASFDMSMASNLRLPLVLRSEKVEVMGLAAAKRNLLHLILSCLL